MSFYSVAFFGFVLIFLILHSFIGDIAPKHQWIVRLIAGVTYFTYLSGVKIIFVLASAISIWSGALLLHQQSLTNKAKLSANDISPEDRKAIKQQGRRTLKIYTGALIIFNLGLLVFAKYLLPVTYHPIALPLGISFYSLQAVSYVIDVYGGKYEPQRNPAKVLLYLCWFPQLIQGPINRYDSVGSDLYKPYVLHAPELRFAFYLFLFGAVKKYALADLLAPMVSASLNDSSAAYPGSFLLFGALMFAIEQYADFSGGINMVMGISMLFGVKMDENFRQPYFATSLADFWRRWHITLGSWMRDYVFYPFVTTKPVMKLTKYVTKRFGSHVGRSVTGGISNILVFSLVGLWHGSEKHYIAWGLYNGLIIAVEDALAPAFSSLNRFLKIREDSRGIYVFRIIRTFMIVVFAGYFDVIGPTRVGLACFTNTVAHFDITEGLSLVSSLFSEGISSPEAAVTAAIVAALLFTNSVHKEQGRSPLKALCSLPFWLRWGICFALIGLLLYSFTVSSGIRGFMYAAF